MKNNDIAQKKQLLRQQLKNTRSELNTNQKHEFSQIICDCVLSQREVITAETIFIYISYATEVETHGLITQLLESGKTLAVPKILSKNQMVAVKFTSWDDLEAAELGILTPKSATPLNDHFDICITPGLGFTSCGKRIGFGAGYYDRWFAENSVDKKIALAFEEQIMANIPTDEYDQLIDRIITEQRVIDVQN